MKRDVAFVILTRFFSGALLGILGFLCAQRCFGSTGEVLMVTVCFIAMIASLVNPTRTHLIPILTKIYRHQSMK